MLSPDPSARKADNLPVPTLEIPFSSAKYKRLSSGPPVRGRRQAEKRFSEVPGADVINTVSTLGQQTISLSCKLQKLPDSFYHKKSDVGHLELSKGHLLAHPIENPERFFQELSAKGYDHLTQVLQGEKGFPLIQTMNVKFPELMEQLIDLHLIIEKKESIHKKGIGEDIMIFALHAAQKATTADFFETRWMLGKLIFLTEQNFIRTINEVNLEKIEDILDWVRLQFDLEVMKIQNKLSHYVSKQEAAQLQNPIQSSKTQLATELAKIIITDIGTVNTGIITPLLQMFVKDLKNPLNHELSLIYTLRLLEQNPLLRNQFLKVTAPSPKTPAALLVRLVLGYPNNTELTENDARKSILSAMLSRLRQSPAGSCFATCWAIELLSCQISQCFRDFSEIIHSSKLTRKVNQQTIDFPFLLNASGKSLEAEIWVDAFGMLKCSEDAYYLWQVPGFMAACRTIGINQEEEAIKKILLDYFHDKRDAGRFKPITVDEFLRLLADWAIDQNLAPGETAISLFRKASFAYDSQISNPILNAWMNAIAGMSEAISSSMIKTQIISAVCGSLDYLESDATAATANKIKLSVYSKIFSVLSKRIRLEYDPSIKGIRNDGAFVLYDKGSMSASRGWMRLDSPRLFQNFIAEIIDSARQNISLAIINQRTLQLLEEYISRLKRLALSDAFLTKLIQLYDPVFAYKEPSLEKLLTLPYTPWITKCGNDTARTLQVYLEKNSPPEMEKYVSVNAEQLLAKIIDDCKATFMIDHSYKTNPGKLISLRIPGIHAFSLMMGHPSLAPAYQAQSSSADWIKQNMIEPGKKIALSEVGSVLHNNLLQFCLQFILTKENKEKFVKSIKHLSDKATIYSFRNRLLEQLQAAAPLEGVPLKERLIKIDTFLCQNLPSTSKYQLEKNAIHFADTNFSADEKDIHYCFMFNPGSGQIEIWEALDNGQFWTAVDQSICAHQTWEFCKNPDDILPGNEKLLV